MKCMKSAGSCQSRRSWTEQVLPLMSKQALARWSCPTDHRVLSQTLAGQASWNIYQVSMNTTSDLVARPPPFLKPTPLFSPAFLYQCASPVLQDVSVMDKTLSRVWSLKTMTGFGLSQLHSANERNLARGGNKASAHLRSWSTVHELKHWFYLEINCERE